jgi:hypothetical protein
MWVILFLDLVFFFDLVSRSLADFVADKFKSTDSQEELRGRVRFCKVAK